MKARFVRLAETTRPHGDDRHRRPAGAGAARATRCSSRCSARADACATPSSATARAPAFASWAPARTAGCGPRMANALRACSIPVSEGVQRQHATARRRHGQTSRNHRRRRSRRDTLRRDAGGGGPAPDAHRRESARRRPDLPPPAGELHALLCEAVRHRGEEAPRRCTALSTPCASASSICPKRWCGTSPSATSTRLQRHRGTDRCRSMRSCSAPAPPTA